MGKFDSSISTRNDTTTVDLIKSLQKPKKPKPQRTKEMNDRETKSRRTEILLRPSTYKALKAEAEKDERSLNSLINRILEAHIAEGKSQ